MANKMLGARVDPETLARFHQICEESGSTASDEIRRFVMAVVTDGKLPDTDDAITPVVLTQRIRDVVDPRLSALEEMIASIHKRLPENTENKSEITENTENVENELETAEGTGTFDITPYLAETDPEPVESEPVKPQTHKPPGKPPKTTVSRLIREESTNPASRENDGLTPLLNGGQDSKKLAGVDR